MSYLFLFLSIVLLLVLHSLGIFNNINLYLLVLYLNSILLIIFEDRYKLLRNILFLISLIIFFYITYIVYIHINLGNFTQQFST